MTPILHDAAFAGAMLILELFDTSPGAPKHELLPQIMQIILLSIREAERIRSEDRRAIEPSDN